MSVMGLLAHNGRAAGSVQFTGKEILGLPPTQLNHIRGEKIAMIFQDPMTSLNPYLTVSRQMTEVLVAHKRHERSRRRRGRRSRCWSGAHPRGRAAHRHVSRTNSPAACASA